MQLKFKIVYIKFRWNSCGEPVKQEEQRCVTAKIRKRKNQPILIKFSQQILRQQLLSHKRILRNCSSCTPAMNHWIFSVFHKEPYQKRPFPRRSYGSQWSKSKGAIFSQLKTHTFLFLKHTFDLFLLMICKLGSLRSGFPACSCNLLKVKLIHLLGVIQYLRGQEEWGEQKVHGWSLDKDQVSCKMSTIVHLRGEGGKVKFGPQLLNDPLQLIVEVDRIYALNIGFSTL